MRLQARYGAGFAHEVIDLDTGTLVASVFVEGFEGMELARLFAAARVMAETLAYARAVLLAYPVTEAQAEVVRRIDAALSPLVGR